MRRIPLLTMAVAMCAGVCLFPRPAAADIGNMQKAKGAVFGKTGVQKKLDLMEKALAKGEELSGKGWEGEAQFVIDKVAIRSSDRGGDALVQLRKMVRPVKPGGKSVKRS